ncbi:MAG: VCBS repeat-containing protein, partial [Deltaproteobacteria bacterium]|nr:VCBS repeat-containing protein [Deltaproteobacteria bacterium]
AFPHALGGDGASAPVTADLDNDGIEEIILGDSNGFVHAFRADASELPGWPVMTDPLETHSEATAFTSGAIATPVHSSVLGAPSVGDLDRDGRLEVVATDLQGRVYAWQHDGTRRAGFPQRTLPEYSFAFRSERDLGTPEGQVPDRTNRHSEDNRLGRALLGGVALGNLDRSADGSLEIVAGAFDRHLYAWHADGTAVNGWPVLLKDPAKVAAVDPITNEVTLVAGSGARLGSKIIVPPSLGDLDGDGDLEVVAAVNEEYVEPPNAVFENVIIQLFQLAGVLDSGNTRVYALHHDGVAHGDSGLTRGWNPDAFVPGWPVKTALLTTELLPTVGTGSNGPPALADVDRDGTLEIATMSAIGPIYVFDHDGVGFFGRHPGGQDRTLASETLGAGSNSTDTPTFGGLGALVLTEFAGRDAGYQVVAPAAGLGKLIDNQLPARQLPADNQLGAWRIAKPDGSADDRQLLRAFPRVMNDLQFLAGPAVADIDADGRPEAIQGSGVYDLHAVDSDGVEAPGWPKFTHGWMVQSPAVGDVDGDGHLEVVGVTREGSLFVWRTSGAECGFIPWRRWHHDEWGSGNDATDARPPAGVRAEDITIVGVSSSDVILDMPIPGDDLFCGRAAPLRPPVRYAETPITADASYAAAAPVPTVAASGTGRRQHGEMQLSGPFAGRTLYFAFVASDEAGNRSPLTSFGPITFPGEAATPTATAVPTGTAQATVTHTPTATPTQAPTDAATFTATATARATDTAEATATATPTATDRATNTITASPTPTATVTLTPIHTEPSTPTATATGTAVPTRTATTKRPTDDGCNVGSTADAGPAWWPLAFVAVLLARRRRA